MRQLFPAASAIVVVTSAANVASVVAWLFVTVRVFAVSSQSNLDLHLQLHLLAFVMAVFYGCF
ncbi:hypothetical protein KHA80_06355 [Anaerobacillus sp. HL2]|nr:hypothetical protein KHA80_06355 [Anaerobacillus sp. HL2]